MVSLCKPSCRIEKSTFVRVFQYILAESMIFNAPRKLENSNYFNRSMEEDENKRMFAKDCGVLTTHASRGNDKHERERRDIRAYTRSVQVSDFHIRTDSIGMRG